MSCTLRLIMIAGPQTKRMTRPATVEMSFPAIPQSPRLHKRNNPSGGNTSIATHMSSVRLRVDIGIDLINASMHSLVPPQPLTVGSHRNESVEIGTKGDHSPSGKTCQHVAMRVSERVLETIRDQRDQRVNRIEKRL